MLDFFAGSGTTGLAAQKNNREFLLIDQGPEAIAVTEARLKLKARKKPAASLARDQRVHPPEAVKRRWNARHPRMSL